MSEQLSREERKKRIEEGWMEYPPGTWVRQPERMVHEKVADPKTVVMRLLAHIDRLERIIVRMYKREDCQSDINKLAGELYLRQGYYDATSEFLLEQMAEMILKSEVEK